MNPVNRRELETLDAHLQTLVLHARRAQQLELALELERARYRLAPFHDKVPTWEVSEDARRSQR